MRAASAWSSPIPILRFVLAGLAGLLLSACGDPLSLIAPESTLYRLDGSGLARDLVPALPLQIVIEEPMAEAALNTSRIAVATETGRLDYVANMAWTDRAPRLVHLALLRTVQVSGAFAGVGGSSGDVRADLVLKSTLHDFQAQYRNDAFSGVPRILLAVDAMLVQMPGRRVVASRQFTHQAAADSGEVADLVAAFDAGLAAMAADIAAWSHDMAGQSTRDS